MENIDLGPKAYLDFFSLQGYVMQNYDFYFYRTVDPNAMDYYIFILYSYFTLNYDRLLFI